MFSPEIRSQALPDTELLQNALQKLRHPSAAYRIALETKSSRPSPSLQEMTGEDTQRLTYSLAVTLMVASDNKFRSEFVQKASGKEVGSRFLTVSDGSQVSIFVSHPLSSRQYSVQKWEDPLHSSYSNALGLTGTVLIYSEGSDRDPLKLLPNPRTKISREEIGSGKAKRVRYTLVSPGDEPQSETTLRVFIDPSAAQVRRLEEMHRSLEVGKPFEFRAIEEISPLQSKPLLPPNTFNLFPRKECPDKIN